MPFQNENNNNIDLANAIQYRFSQTEQNDI